MDNSYIKVLLNNLTEKEQRGILNSGKEYVFLEIDNFYIKATLTNDNRSVYAQKITANEWNGRFMMLHTSECKDILSED